MNPPAKPGTSPPPPPPPTDKPADKPAEKSASDTTTATDKPAEGNGTNSETKPQKVAPLSVSDRCVAMGTIFQLAAWSMTPPKDDDEAQERLYQVQDIVMGAAMQLQGGGQEKANNSALSGLLR